MLIRTQSDKETMEAGKKLGKGFERGAKADQPI